MPVEPDCVPSRFWPSSVKAFIAPFALPTLARRRSFLIVKLIPVSIASIFASAPRVSIDTRPPAAKAEKLDCTILRAVLNEALGCLDREKPANRGPSRQWLRA